MDASVAVDQLLEGREYGEIKTVIGEMKQTNGVEFH